MRVPQTLAAREELRAANRRKHQRNRTFANGTISTVRGTVNCRVLDVSHEGARVRVEGANTKPEEIPGAHEPISLMVKGLGVFNGVVAWQRGNSLGIQIHDGHPVAPDAGRAREAAVQPIESAHAAASTMGGRTGGRPDPLPVSTVTALPSRGAIGAPGNSAHRAERERIDAALAVLQPLIFDRILPEVAVRMPEARLAQEIATLVAETAQEAKLALSAPDQLEIRRRILDEILGFGPLEPLFADPTVSDILVNGPRQVYAERRGRLELTDITFTDDQHVLNIAARMVTKAGRRVDESSPIADARLPDGSRVNVVIPPLALRGPMLSVRKFSKSELTLETLAQTGAMSASMAAMLKVAARCRLNILISGGTGAGKTTVLNALSQMIDPNERILTIEDAAELQLQLPHVAGLETRPANLEGKNEVTMRDLLRNALRMRPDRIIMGEVRGPEAFELLQAMNTGHDGSLCTIHASGPREALTRLENMVLMSGYDLPARFIRSQIASAVHLIVQIARMRDGKRRVTSITEIAGTETDVITSQELFSFRAEGDGPQGEVLGRFVYSGLRPRFGAKAEQYGLGQALQRAVAAADERAGGAD